LLSWSAYQDGAFLSTSTNTNFSLNALSASSTYSFYIQAYDAAGNVSTSSNTILVTTDTPVDIQAPSAPTALSASNITETSALLSWSAATDNVGVSGYNVYQDGALVSTTSGTGFSIIGLSASSTYSFYVQAYDAAGNVSGSSNSTTVTTLTPPDTQAPSAPSTLIATNVSIDAADLSWSAATDNIAVVGYNVYQDGSLVSTTGSNTTAYNVTGLSAATSYDFYIEAFDAAGNVSNASNIASITTTAPPANTDILASYFENGWDGWTDGGGDCFRYSGSYSAEGSYSIRIRDNSGTRSAMTSPTLDFSNFAEVNVQFSFRARSMENGEDFWLRYYDGNSWQTVETFVRGTDFNNGPFYTVNVVMDANTYNFVSDARIRLQCDASVNNDRVYIDAVVVTGISNGTYQVLEDQVRELADTVEEEAVQGINTPSITTANAIDIPNTQGLDVYPNPTSEFVNIRLFEAPTTPLSIEIFDVVGNRVDLFELQADQVSIRRDMSHLTDGVYVLRYVNKDGELQMHKISVIR